MFAADIVPDTDANPETRLPTERLLIEPDAALSDVARKDAVTDAVVTLKKVATMLPIEPYPEEIVATCKELLMVAFPKTLIELVVSVWY